MAVLQRQHIPPTVKMVRDYCSERHNDIEPEAFMDYYTSVGWKIGSKKMKDWQAAVRTWERSDKKKRANRGSIVQIS